MTPKECAAIIHKLPCHWISCDGEKCQTFKIIVSQIEEACAQVLEEAATMIEHHIEDCNSPAHSHGHDCAPYLPQQIRAMKEKK